MPTSGALRPAKDQDVITAAPERGDAFAGRDIAKEANKDSKTKKGSKTYPRPMTRRNTEDWCKPVTILDWQQCEVFEEANTLELALPSLAYTEGAGRTSYETDLSWSSSITSSSTAETSSSAIPEKRHRTVVSRTRHTYCNVYRRLFSIVSLGNLIGFIALLVKDRRTGDLPHLDIATSASANLMVAILIRQDYIINALFRICWLVPLSAPLRFRRTIAKVYEYGGVHSGASVSGTLWFVMLTIVITQEFARDALRWVSILTLTYILLLLLSSITIFAYPALRFKNHNRFERTHRFAGWAAIALFWVELGLIVWSIQIKTGATAWRTLTTMPTFWFLTIITIHTVLPWLQLHKMDFVPEKLSEHALRLHFKEQLPAFSGICLSDAPLKEWHPFATFPSATGEGGSLIISNAGDWTKLAIDKPSTSYWVKGVPRTGVLSMACVFRSVVLVTTGSGIGPCLSFLTAPSRRQPCRLLWSTPRPMRTFGETIVKTVYQVDPQAMIVDTKLSDKRPDMVMLTYQMFVESGAEAVFVISNPKLTKRLVYEMESRGIPAYGPIWDS